MLTLIDCAIFGTGHYPVCVSWLDGACVQLHYEEVVPSAVSDFLQAKRQQQIVGALRFDGKKLHRWNTGRYQSNLRFITFKQFEKHERSQTVADYLAHYCLTTEADLRLPMVLHFWRLAELSSKVLSEIDPEDLQRVRLARLMCQDRRVTIMHMGDDPLSAASEELLIKQLAVMCDNGMSMILLSSGEKMLHIPFACAYKEAEYKIG